MAHSRQLAALRLRRWLRKHPNVTFHFIPTSVSWLNRVEGWFSILQGQPLSGASFTSVEQLKAHIDAFIATYNTTAEPFVWTKSKVYQKRIIPAAKSPDTFVLGGSFRRPKLYIYI